MRCRLAALFVWERQGAAEAQSASAEKRPVPLPMAQPPHRHLSMHEGRRSPLAGRLVACRPQPVAAAGAEHHQQQHARQQGHQRQLAAGAVCTPAEGGEGANARVWRRRFAAAGPAVSCSRRRSPAVHALRRLAAYLLASLGPTAVAVMVTAAAREAVRDSGAWPAAAPAPAGRRWRGVACKASVRLSCRASIADWMRGRRLGQQRATKGFQLRPWGSAARRTRFRQGADAMWVAMRLQFAQNAASLHF